MASVAQQDDETYGGGVLALRVGWAVKAPGGEFPECLAVAKCGETDVVCAGLENGQLALYDSSTGRELGCLQAHSNGGVLAMAVAGSFVVSGGCDGAARVWDITKAVKHAAAAGENTAIDSRVTAAEALVREVSVDGSTKTRGGTWVEAVAASGDGRPLFAAAGGKSVTMFGLEGGREATKFADVGSTVTALQFMGEGDGRRELAASCYGGVSVWEDTAEEDAAPSSQHAYKGALECCVSSPGAGTWLVAGCNDHSVRIWFRPIEARNFEMGGYMAKITRAAFEPASGRYMVTNGGNVPMVWDFSGDGPNGRIPVGLFGHDGVVRELAWAPGAKEPMAKDAMVPAGVAALATSADDNTVLVWDVTQWEKGMPHRCFPFAAAEPGEKITALRWTRRAGLVCCLENGDVVCYQLPRPMTAAAQGGEELLPGDGSGQ